MNDYYLDQDCEEWVDRLYLQGPMMQRARARVPQIMLDLFFRYGVEDFWLAGGALLKDFNDIDLFPSPSSEKQFGNLINDPPKHISKTRNALTLEVEGQIIQLCSYSKPSLKKLVESFDFAHCQIGVSFIGHKPVNVYYTDDFAKAMASQTTWYTGSEYPLSSLCRIPKVSKKFNLTRNETSAMIVSVLADIVRRGFTSKEDLKDQFDAVDLAYLVEDFNSHDVLSLYEKLLR